MIQSSSAFLLLILSIVFVCSGCCSSILIVCFCFFHADSWWRTTPPSNLVLLPFHLGLQLFRQNHEFLTKFFGTLLKLSILEIKNIASNNIPVATISIICLVTCRHPTSVNFTKPPLVPLSESLSLSNLSHQHDRRFYQGALPKPWLQA